MSTTRALPLASSTYHVVGHRGLTPRPAPPYRPLRVGLLPGAIVQASDHLAVAQEGGKKGAKARLRRLCKPGAADRPLVMAISGKRNERGLPIGNLTSQFWANVYLYELDQFAKRRLGCRYYVRYMDDVVLLATEPAELVRARTAIAAFARERLRLDLRADQTEPFRVARGVDFVGWKTWWDCWRKPPGWRSGSGVACFITIWMSSLARGVARKPRPSIARSRNCAASIPTSGGETDHRRHLGLLRVHARERRGEGCPPGGGGDLPQPRDPG